MISPEASGTIPNLPHPAPNALLSGPRYLAPAPDVVNLDVNGDCQISSLDGDAVVARINLGTQ